MQTKYGIFYSILFYYSKGQFYGVTLEYRASPTENMLLANLTEVKSVVVLVFR